MISALKFSRHRQLALFASLFLSTALFVHWTFNDASYSTTFGSGRSSGLGLLPSRWSLSDGRIRGGPAGAWGIDRQLFTYTHTGGSEHLGVGGGMEQGVAHDASGEKGMRKMYLHGHENGQGGSGVDELVIEEQQVVFDTHNVLRKTREVWGRCQEEDELERYFGRTNIRMSRGYEGSHYKLRRFIEKILRGEPVTLSVIGGSGMSLSYIIKRSAWQSIVNAKAIVTKGHHVEKEDIWFSKLSEWVDSFYDVRPAVEDDDSEVEEDAQEEDEDEEVVENDSEIAGGLEVETETAVEEAEEKAEDRGDPDIGPETGSGPRVGEQAGLEAGDPDETRPSEGRERDRRRKQREMSKRVLKKRMKGLGSIEYVNGAKPAVGSDYFSFCYPLHIPPSSDLVLVELAVNDDGSPEHVVNMENLLRGLLAMESEPAVMLVEAVAFSNGGMGGGGGRMHLSVAQYYDVPVINQRHIMANHLARYPELVTHYFAHEWWGVDTRHIGTIAHLDLARLVSSLIRDATCSMLSEPDYVLPPHRLSITSLSGTPSDTATSTSQPPHPFGFLPAHPTPGVPKPEDGERPGLSPSSSVSASSALSSSLSSLQALQSSHSFPSGALSWSIPPSSEFPLGRVMPPLLNTPPELGLIPRMGLLEGWNPNLDHALPPFRPMCLSTDAKEERYQLRPSGSEGWEQWTHEEHKDKPYLRATIPGSWVEFGFETSLGVVKVYTLKSRSFGLGDVRCTVDGEGEGRVVQGYWDRDENIGQNTVIRDDLKPGRHTIRCELLEDTHDPEGGTEFRMISLMSL